MHGVLKAKRCVLDWGVYIVEHGSCTAGDPGAGKGVPMTGCRLSTTGGTGCTGWDTSDAPGKERGAHSRMRGMHGEVGGGRG